MRSRINLFEGVFVVRQIPAYRKANWVEGKVSGYLALWGSRQAPDCYGTYFDRTNKPDLGLLRNEQGEIYPIRLMYEHGQDSKIGLNVIGAVTRVWEDDQGIAFEGALNDSPYRDRLIEELAQGMLGVSSASSEHLSRFGEDKRFDKWLVTEVSLTANPCEPRMPAAAVRSEKPTDCGCEGKQKLQKQGKGKARRAMLTLEQMGINPQMSFEEMIAALTEALGAEAAAALLQKYTGGAGMEAPAEPPLMEEPPAEEMTDEEPQMLSRPKGDQGDMGKTIRSLQRRLDGLIDMLMTETESAAPPVRSTPVSVVGEVRFNTLKTDEMLFGYMVGKRDGVKFSESYLRNMVGKATENANNGGTLSAIRSMIRPLRAGEVMISTGAGAGDEWVGTAWSDFVWEQARSDRLLGKLTQRGMLEQVLGDGVESMKVLSEGSDPTLYGIAQSADNDATGRPTVVVTASPAGTSAATLTPGALGAAISYSRILEEDAIPVALPQLNRKVQLAIIEGIDKLLLNGDTTATASTNINLIDGTPAASAYYLQSNGLRKLPLVTTTAMSRDGGALDVEDYRALIALMPAAIQERMDGMVFIVDPYTHTASLNLPEVKADGSGINGTVVSGLVSKMFGVDVIRSGFLPKTNTAGKVSATPGNNTKGTILLVYAPYWIMGRKRDVLIETQYDALAQARTIVASARVGFAYYSATGSAAASYNITV